MLTMIDKKVAVRVTNTAGSSYTIEKRKQIANFSIRGDSGTIQLHQTSKQRKL